MGQNLTHGIYLPDEGERNCYNGLASNWSILDGAVGTVAEHSTQISGKAPLVHTHSKADITDFPAYGTTAGTICEGNDSRLSDARTPVAHTHSKADITDLFNSANTWTGDNTYTKYQNIVIDGTEIGVAPNAKNSNGLLFKDKNGVNIGWLRHQYDTSGDVSIEMLVSNKYKNGALDPTGTQAYQGVKQVITSTGVSYFNWSGYVNNSLYPYTTETFNIGASTHQWNNLYAKNYYYNGTAWGLDKANEWTRNNTFTSVLQQRINSVYSQIPATDRFAVHEFIGTDSNRLFAVNCADRSSGQREISLLLYDTDGTFQASGLFKESDNSFSFRPRNSNNNNTVNLGTSTNKWKTLNGTNPGALSLPGAYQAINDKILNPNGELNAIDINGGNNTWVSDVDCYLYFYIPNNKFTWIRIFWPPTLVRCGQTFVPVPNESSDYSGFVPVPANTTVVIQIKGTQAPVFRRSACLGNV